MAGPNLPTNVGSGTFTNRYSHVNTVHTYVDKLDTTFLSASNGQVPTYDSTSGTYKPVDPASVAVSEHGLWVDGGSGGTAPTGTTDATSIFQAKIDILNAAG